MTRSARHPRTSPVLVVACFAVVAVSGCMADPSFDGVAAWHFVDELVYDDDGLRPRWPAAPDHHEAAAWLAAQMVVPGWHVTWQNFTGADYAALDHRTVSAWIDACPEEDMAERDGLRFHNLYARLPGHGQAPRDEVWLAAHWDAKEDAAAGGRMPGANDGGSGVGLLLEMQRYILERQKSGTTWPFDVVVAFFDGEDGFEDCHPLAGSLYAAQNRPTVDRLLLLDMVGDPDARFVREAASSAADPDLVHLLHDLAPDFGLAENFPGTTRTITDDHIPFIDRGIHAVDLVDAGRPGTFPPYWHTVRDTPDKVSPDMLARVGGLVYAVLDDDRFLQTMPA